MKLVNVSVLYSKCAVQYNLRTGYNTITASGTTYTISPGSYNICVLLALLNATISGITATYSSTTFRVTFTGKGSFTLSFSQGIVQVLGFLPNTTYTANSSFYCVVITAPNAVNLLQPF